LLGLILLLQTLTVAVSGPVTSPEYLPLRVAEAEGYFAQAGLALTLRSVRSETDAGRALAKGAADLSATSVAAALRFGAAKDGEVPRIVFGLTAAPPVLVAVPARSARPARTMADLAGRAVGISSSGAPEHTWFLGLLAAANLRVSQVTLQSYGERGVGAALAADRVGAGLIGEPLASRLLADGTVVPLVDLRDPRALAAALGHPTVNAAVFAPAQSRLADSDLEAVCRALLRATERIEQARPEELARRLPAEVVGVPDDFARRVEAARKVSLPNGWVEADALEGTVTMIRRHIPLPRALKIPGPSALFREEPLRRVISSPPGKASAPRLSPGQLRRAGRRRPASEGDRGVPRAHRAARHERLEPRIKPGRHRRNKARGAG
jgi:ABC-type nitrate/sulfonate/bicarbonate transport system substrate-binding protein